ncbi:hypothetical protein N4T77_16955 [Clostridium sp. CX1]|uniref:hypothetical protein n=1 Tax=Clostridium sp. CX1 TaxID=2978346 RepID=UPI0021C1EBC9|nr:hypothetical protein [Clostridium sp. CX1]MCT8978279.1 hypothetical protein [Clostridium sp. CX1]
MFYCKVGNCPVENKEPICCLHCDKRKDCPNACKQEDFDCNLMLEVKEIKKELPKQSKHK